MCKSIAVVWKELILISSFSAGIDSSLTPPRVCVTRCADQQAFWRDTAPLGGKTPLPFLLISHDLGRNTREILLVRKDRLIANVYVCVREYAHLAETFLLLLKKLTLVGRFILGGGYCFTRA